MTTPETTTTKEIEPKAGKAPEWSDYTSRTPEGLARLFEYFGKVEAPQLDAVLYQELCCSIAADPELLELAARAPVTQPAVNLLLAGAHYLLLKGARHPLREYYPALAAGECGPPEAAFPAFRSFCLEHRRELGSLIEKRLTQTNVIQRCTLLLPAFATVFERAGRRPLALIEVGPSAGLNMQWSRFRYTYRSPDDARLCAEWGHPEARVEVEAELRGDVPLPKLSPELRVAWRRGIDIHPVDPDDEDAVLWLRALVWPEHVGRQERLSRAIEVAREDPPEIIAGDAGDLLPELLEQAPRDATLCVYGTHTLYQFPREARRRVFRALQAAAAERPVWFVSCESTGDRCSELRLTEYAGSERETFLLARCSPHGRWLEWSGTPLEAAATVPR
jgi:hypothetical protein